MQNIGVLIIFTSIIDLPFSKKLSTLHVWTKEQLQLILWKKYKQLLIPLFYPERPVKQTNVQKIYILKFVN